MLIRRSIQYIIRRLTQAIFYLVFIPEWHSEVVHRRW
jgi:hypothetical protein